MKYIITLKDSKWGPMNDKETMYQNEYNEWFVGPPSEVVIGDKYVVEISDGTPSGGYRRIIQFK